MNNKPKLLERIDPTLLHHYPTPLHELVANPDWSVRLDVARRIDPSQLPEMMGDTHWIVRREVAMRIPTKYLGLLLMRETSPKVLEIIQERVKTLG